MTLFDTDIFTALLDEVDTVVARALRITREQQAIPIVTAEEVIRGQFNAIRQAESRKSKINIRAAYAYFQKSLNDIAAFNVAPYSDAAHEIFQTLRAAKIRIGTQDLRIASIALAHDAKLVSRNRRDYELVPNLNLEIWN